MAKPKPVINAGDRLSSLPDDVISHILSFLQTKYAVGTAVLSRRWEDLWTRVSNLDLEIFPPDEKVKYVDVLEERMAEFSRFVDKVMSQHKNLDSLRRFRLYCSIRSRMRKLRRVFRFNKEWVFGPLLEEIDIVIEGGENGVQFPQGICSFPQNFYTLKNLRVVKLEGVILSSANASVFLPSLKILQIRDVSIMGHESLGSLISGCPVLETARFEGCFFMHWKAQDILVLSFPSLKNLKMISFGRYDMRPIVIVAPNLEELQLREFKELKLMGSSPMPCLHSAFIGIGQFQSSDLIGVLNQISNAKEIFLNGEILNHLSYDDYAQLPVFPKLKHLTIGMGDTSWILHYLLNSASKLQSLVIDLGTPYGDMDGEILEHQGDMDGEILEHLRTPECLLSSLEEIEIKHLVLNGYKRKLLEYLLKVGTVLKKVNVHVELGDLAIEDREYLVTLLKRPRGSSCCEARVVLPNNEEIFIDSDNETSIDQDTDDGFASLMLTLMTDLYHIDDETDYLEDEVEGDLKQSDG